MKIERKKAEPVFEPVVITLETEDEVKSMRFICKRAITIAGQNCWYKLDATEMARNIKIILRKF